MSQGAPRMSTLSIRCALAACVLFAAGCSGGETVVIRGSTSVPGVPRDREALQAIEDYRDVERSLTLARGQGFVIDIESQRNGVPFLVDTAAVDHLIVDTSDPMSGILSADGSKGRAYLISRSASNALGSYCLCLKERVSIMGELIRSSDTVDVEVSFGEGYNPVGFVGVYPARMVRVRADARVVARDRAVVAQPMHLVVR